MQDLNEQLKQVNRVIKEKTFFATQCGETAKLIEKQVTLLEIERDNIKQQIKSQRKEETVNE